uniref:Phospholipid--sterol O-acyltransferase n=1 Tax=Chenopodium quinoa TaxID=63459 RepID=A0A803LA74_CHEQI
MAAPHFLELKMRGLILIFLILGTFFKSPTLVYGEEEFKGDYRKLSGIIIPGFASTQLRAWSILDCPYSPLDFNPLDLVWLDTTKLLSAVNCWLKCIMLEPYNQTDHPECKSRPDSGLSAITELDPGYITGPLSSVWKEWVKWCIEFGIEANAIIAVPYDWRLSPSKLEERDLYFHKLKLTFETAHKLRGGPSLVFAHSLGNNVFRYFLEWLKLEVAPKEYMNWLDKHIHAYFAVGSDAHPSVLDVMENTSMECNLPTQLSFTAREVSDGTFFKAIEDYDPDSKRLLHQLQKSYHGDPVVNPLTPWDRPPLKNVFCIYGVDSKTEVGYYFAPSGKPYPDNWIVTDIIYEIEGSLYSRSGNLVEGNPGATSGDETVAYHSLSWCKNWLGPNVNITRTPQTEHDGTDVQVELNVTHDRGADIIPNMTRSPRVKYITYYEDSESIPGRRTAVWELDKVNHRNMVRSPALMRELWLEMWHDINPAAKSKFVTKAKRGPLRNDDCYWDYGKARCAWPEYCEYRYAFGDVHLGQSCRLRDSSADLLLHYI